MSGIVAIIQARMGSSRLPGKVLLPLAGKPMLWHVVDRLQTAEALDTIAVATSTEAADDAIVEFCESESILCFRGSENDVLDRYYQSAVEFEAEIVVRVTADCPLIDPVIVERLIYTCLTEGADHVGALAGSGGRAVGLPAFPEGAGASCLRASALRGAWERAECEEDREHVVTYLVRHPEEFRSMYLVPDTDFGHLRWTVDTTQDLALAEMLYDTLYVDGEIISPKAAIWASLESPTMAAVNSGMVGREKYRHIWNDLRLTDDNVATLIWPAE